MDRPIIPIKTPAGQAEMSSRQRRISQRHRTMLLLVDGKRTEAQVRALSAQAGVPGICFDELMGLGLIVAPQPEPPGAARNGAASAAAAASAASAASSAPPIDGNSGFGDDSELPPSRTLPPESIFSDTAVGNAAPSSWLQTEPEEGSTGDDVLERAREMLLRAVRVEAPVAGSLTIFRLRRARTRVELEQLIDEVAARIGKPPHSLVAEQTLRRVRNVLDGRDTSPAPL